MWLIFLWHGRQRRNIEKKNNYYSKCILVRLPADFTSHFIDFVFLSVIASISVVQLFDCTLPMNVMHSWLPGGCWTTACCLRLCWLLHTIPMLCVISVFCMQTEPIVIIHAWGKLTVKWNAVTVRYHPNW